ncbi:MAG: histidinol-phosphate transaminase [Thomasclavelia sp.]|jgi:histidinol-phosphate aminotransferase|nr:histidinol-phosphate transaminase [Thomasclavelia sp.]
MDIKHLLRNEMKDARGYTPGGTPLPPIPDGITVAKLNANENQFGPSKKVCEYMKNNLEDMYLYPLSKVTEARRAIAEYYGFNEDNISIAAGSSSLICGIADLFLNKGDEVLISSPSYVAYYLMPERYGAKLIEVDNKNFASDIDELLNNINDKTKLVCIVNPNNPTGGIVSNEMIKKYMDNVPDDVITVIDEAYFEWIDDDSYESAMKYVKENKNVIVLKTFSKIYGLAGLRAGFAVSTKEIVEELHKIEFNYGINRLVAGAIPVALADKEYLEASRANNTTGRNYIYNEMKKMGIEVEMSYTSFLYFKTKKDPKEVLLDLNQKGVKIRPFGDYLRVSIGRPEQNEQFIKALKEILG